jgi:2-phosphosulfolactate phosphatase
MSLSVGLGTCLRSRPVTVGPAIEDLLGAGAFLHGLADGKSEGFSPEADGVMWAYRGVADGLGGALHDSVGGRELRGFGFEGDVAVAAAVRVSSAVPVLADGWFVDGGSVTTA